MPNENLNLCPCRFKKCPRFGKCHECIEHHLAHKRYPLPYCKQKSPKKKSNAANP